jgi:hypothetical protein
MQAIRVCALGGALVCALAGVSSATGPMILDLGMQYGDDGTGSCFEVWNYSSTNPALRDPIVVNGASGSVLSDHWTDQFWMAEAAGDASGYRDILITKASASEAWVTDPLRLEFVFLDMPTYSLVGSIGLTVTTRDASEVESVVSLQLPSDAWSGPSSGSVVLGPIVLQSDYPVDFDADEQVTDLRIEMMVMPEPMGISLLVLGTGILALRRRTQ